MIIQFLAYESDTKKRNVNLRFFSGKRQSFGQIPETK